MPVKSLPWSTDEYTKLEPGDLLPRPAPTLEQRVRVVAALATMIRDGLMLGKHSGSLPNAETIRAMLIMNAEMWAEQIEVLKPFLQAYDAVDPKTRFAQILKIMQRGTN